MKFDIINEINEAVKSIKYTSFQIRLCALNSQISISNISKKFSKSSGFSPISEELIHISNSIEVRANELFNILYESLNLSTQERKIIRNREFQNNFFRQYEAKGNQKFNLNELENNVLKKYEMKLIEIREKIEIHFDNLKKIVKETERICKFGKPLVYSVKIESALLGINLDLFNQLAEELFRFISRIELLLVEIQNQNLELAIV